MSDVGATTTNSNSIAVDDEQSLGARSTRSTRSTGSLGAILQMMNNERLRISRHRAPHRGRRRRGVGNRRATAGTAASSKSGDSTSVDQSQSHSRTDGGVEVRRVTENTVIEGDLNNDEDEEGDIDDNNHDSFLDAVNAVQVEYGYGDDNRSILTGMTGKSFEKEVVGAYIDDLTATASGQEQNQNTGREQSHQQSLQIPKNINIIDGTGSNIDGTVIQATQADIDRDVVAFWHNYISTENNQDDDDMSDLDDDDIDGDNEEHEGAMPKSNGRHDAADDDNRSVMSTRSISTHGSLGMLLAGLADDMSRQSIHKMTKSRNNRHGRNGRNGARGGRRPSSGDGDENEEGGRNKPRRGRRKKSESDEVDVELEVDGESQENYRTAPKDDLKEIILQVCNEHQQQGPSNRRQSSAMSVCSSSVSHTDCVTSSTDEDHRVARNRERDAYEKQERMKRQPQSYGECNRSDDENRIPANPTGTRSALATKSLILPTKLSNANRSVSFSSVEVRQYERVLGDHPSSFGPAMSIGWNHHRASTQTIDISDEHSKESKRIDRRHSERRGPRILPRPLREIMLLDLGYSQQDLASANRAIVRAKRARQRTYHNSEGISAKIDENIERAKKHVNKMKRRMSNGNSADPAEEWLRARE